MFDFLIVDCDTGLVTGTNSVTSADECAEAGAEWGNVIVIDLRDGKQVQYDRDSKTPIIEYGF